MSEKGKQYNQRLKAFLIYKFLLDNSDENNCFSATTIANHLSKDYDMPAERRSVCKDIEAINIMLYAMHNFMTINEAIKEVDVLTDTSWQAIVYNGSKKGYYVKHRYYDIDEEYSLNDVKTIAECIYTTKFITEEKANSYVNIITKILTSTEQAKEIQHKALLLDRGKTISPDVFNSVRKINKAMKTKIGKNPHTPEKISFKYLTTTINKTAAERRHGEKYIVSPYKLVINDGNYYLLGYDDKSAAARTYRVDRMKDIKPLGTPRDGEELFRTVNDKAFVMQKFGMYDGKKEFVTLRFINPLLDTVIDKFGSKLFYQKVDDKHFSVQVEVPITDQFFGWLCGFGKRVKIISPPPIQDKFKEYLDKIISIY